ncbi:ABC transporter substrate-binding protein, partial [Microbacterium sp.]|uniref:ABC transporter substrate-binding protein n=1 Tax=Microbacterium sp. TaxID=51671 RepID=UPI00289F1F70
MGLRRRVAATAVALVAVTLAACAPALPESVVPGTHAVVGVTGEVTSSNPLASPTPANLELAAATRAGFGAMVDGEFVPDPSFGAVTISGDDPFTVRYDLAEPSWSDGTPVDAADLLLGWAWAAGILPADDADAGAEAEATDTGTEASLEPEMAGVPQLDEFGRAILVRFAEPTMLWQTAVTAQVPAHIVGRLAFGLDDAMEAKQAVVRAIEDDNATALAKIGEVWQEGFAWGEDEDPSADLLLSSGPYRVDDVTRDATGQSVTLVPNAAYRGGAAAQVARVDLVPAGADAVAEVGARLDVVQVAPTSANDAPIHQLERRDATVATTHDGTVWSLLLRPAGVLTDAAARAAFLRLAPVGDMVDRGAGPWAAAYAKTTSMLAMPGSRAFDVVAEDSGFATALGTPADDAALDREAAGVPAGATVCVLYDRASPFAAGAFAALRDAAAEAGWTVT